jgi:hypothetical protein
MMIDIDNGNKITFHDNFETAIINPQKCEKCGSENFKIIASKKPFFNEEKLKGGKKNHIYLLCQNCNTILGAKNEK